MRSCRVVGTDKIPLSSFTTALRLVGCDIDSDEAECLFANQIMAGYMSCYLSHGLQTVVLHKTLPFPPRRKGGPFLAAT